MKSIYLTILFISVFFVHSLFAQESNDNEIRVAGSRYVSLKIAKLEKYNRRLERQQKNTLRNLKKREGKLIKRVGKKDSVSSSKFLSGGPNFDSIYRQSRTDSYPANIDGSTKRMFDSLRVISKCGSTNENSITSIGSDDLRIDKLEAEIGRKNLIGMLIARHTSELVNVQKTTRMKGFSHIQKHAFYGKKRMECLKEIANDPSQSEDRAFEILQSVPGFSQKMEQLDGRNNVIDNLAASGADASQLQNLGYQTKQMIQSNFQNKMGASVGAAGKKIGADLGKWHSKQTQITSEVRQTNQAVKSARKSSSLPFRINPMRGKPFFKRFQVQYTANTAKSDDGKNNVIQPGLLLGFRQSETFTYGLGMSSSIGLGKNFQNVSISVDQIGCRSFFTKDIFFGVSAYAGYERNYNVNLHDRPILLGSAENRKYSFAHINNSYSESLLFGVSKKYKVNSKFGGSIQILYDYWWDKKGQLSPLVVRFTSTKN